MATKKAAVLIKDTMQGKCARCSLYRAEPHETFGFCHRYPPIWVIDEEGTGFTKPTVEEDEFCGEFKPLLS